MAQEGDELSKDLLKLISEYQLHVLGFVEAMIARLGDDFLAAYRRDEVPKSGTLDDQHETRYTFHGAGCHVQSVRGEVDFDFGPDGRFDGFDGWRLWQFAAHHQEQYPQFQREAVVESVLGELVADGLVVRPRWLPSPHLCYLREDCGDDEIPSGERSPFPIGPE